MIFMQQTYIYEDTDGRGRDAPSADSIVRVLSEHQRRYVYSTHVGDLVLRHMPLRMKRLLDNIIDVEYPDYRKQIAEQKDALEGMINLDPAQIPQEAVDKLEELSALVAPVQRWYACGVITEPTVNTPEMYDNLCELLSEEETLELDEIVALLAFPRPADSIDDTALNIAERFNVKMVTLDIINNLTVTQANYFASRIEQENQDIERTMRGRR